MKVTDEMAAAASVKNVDTTSERDKRGDDSLHDVREALKVAASEPGGDGEYILALIETIKKTGGSVEIHGVKIMPCDEYGRTGVERDAALDGAPEPVWEYGVVGVHGQVINNGDYEVEQTHRRRKAGPWLPVEGESK